MHRHLDDVELTIFDTETTGLDPSFGDRVVEIAGIRIKGGREIAKFATLVNPLRPISPAAFQVNHISQEMLEGAPTAESAMLEFLRFAKGSCLCSYNAGFDLKFLDSELKLIGEGALSGFSVADILKMARRLVPGLERYALWFVAGKFGVRAKQEHRAMSDVEMTLEVFNRLKEIFYLKGLRDFGQFLNLFSIDPAFLNDLNQQKINRIQEAITLGVKLKIKYLTSSSAAISEREVTPKEIKRDNKIYYMVGHCHLRREERTFRIDGILHMEVI